MQINVVLRWNDYKKMWDMWFPNGNFIEEFRNCRNFKRLFSGLDRKKDNYYTLTARKYET